MKLTNEIDEYAAGNISFDDLKLFVASFKEWADAAESDTPYGDVGAGYPRPNSWEEIRRGRVRGKITLAQEGELMAAVKAAHA